MGLEATERLIARLFLLLWVKGANKHKGGRDGKHSRRTPDGCMGGH